MKLGSLEFHILSDGEVLLDGGAMFGIIPRPLWEKKMPPDARNRVRLAMNCLLIRAGGKRILVETGAGAKMNAKLRDIFGLGEPCLPGLLRDHGLEPADIDIVVNTHLHFDHCGGNTRIERGKIVPTFPNAQYVIQKGEFDHAMHATERERGSYLPDDYAPLADAERLTLIEGDQSIAPGVELIRIPGHTDNMQCVKLTGGGQTAFYFADLVPTAAHLGLAWIMGFDICPLTTLENKKKWISTAVREEWLALFVHDTAAPAAYLRQRNGHWEHEPVTID